MALKLWLGGTSAVQQEDSLTVGGTVTADETFTVTLRDEGGSTTSVETTVSTETPEDAAAEIVADLQASNHALFQAVEWSVDGAVITAKAATPGVPFYCTASTDSASGTFVRASVTANAGPNDWHTAANWSPSGVPVNGDDIAVIRGSHSILYGLETAGPGAGGENFASFVRGGRFTGTIGDPNAGFYLQLGNVVNLEIDSIGGDTWLDGAFENPKVTGVTAGHEVRLDGGIGAGGGGVPSFLTITGPRVRGIVRIADAASVLAAGIVIADCPGATLEIGENVTNLGVLHIASGTVNNRSDLTSFQISGGVLNQLAGEVAGAGSNALSPIIHGGAVNWISDGDLLTATNAILALFGGSLSFADSIAAAVTIGGSLHQFGGALDLTGTKVSITGDYVHLGGSRVGDFV